MHPTVGQGPGVQGELGYLGLAGAARSSVLVLATPLSQPLPTCPASDSRQTGLECQKVAARHLSKGYRAERA